ncbi:SET domain-containing protein 4, partial [Ascosphaera atra]
MPLQLGEEHHAFTKWSIERGVEINGIEPLAMPGQGVGIYAARDIQADETVLTVPLAAMLTIDSMPGSFVELFPEDAPVQGVMAAYLIHGSGVIEGKSPAVKDEGDAAGHGEESGSHHELELWKKVLPSRNAILESMPLAWDEGLRTVPSQATASKDAQTNGASPEHVSTKKRKIAGPATFD